MPEGVGKLFTTEISGMQMVLQIHYENPDHRSTSLRQEKKRKRKMVLFPYGSNFFTQISAQVHVFSCITAQPIKFYTFR